MPTILDVAKLAGVSKSTVSRYISKTGYISKETEEKVQAAMNTLNYKPNAIARSMKSKKTNNIGVIIYKNHFPIASHPFYGEILDAILSEANILGYSVFVTSDEDMSTKSLDAMSERQIDGIIFMSKVDDSIFEYAKSLGIPFVIVNGSTKEKKALQLLNNDYKGGNLVGELLKNYKKVLVIAGPQTHRSHQLRLQGFLESFDNSDDVLISIMSSSKYEEGQRAISELSLTNIDEISVVFATNDMLAIGAMHSLQQLGKSIPEDVAVIGFDNISYSAYTQPTLSTIAIDKLKMGHDAIHILHEMIEKNNIIIQNKIYEPKAVKRNSFK